ncbi:hypothetical protein GE09DRAFT_1195213 [Coniochaeta sp. 2T2.1]|nr:hypothetical protein GE09DRAFT_1195213 [Coniochaeta sp. 2T2.1]
MDARGTYSVDQSDACGEGAKASIMYDDLTGGSKMLEDEFDPRLDDRSHATYSCGDSQYHIDFCFSTAGLYRHWRWLELFRDGTLTRKEVDHRGGSMCVAMWGNPSIGKSFLLNRCLWESSGNRIQEFGGQLPATAQICTYTESYGVIAGRGILTPSPTLKPDERVPFSEYLSHDKRDKTTTTTTTTVSFCTSVTGCGASTITTTEEVVTYETPRPYVVIPRDPQAVNQNLRDTIAAIADNLYESRTDALGTIFFFAPSITQTAANLIGSFDNVAHVYTPAGPLTAQILGPFIPYGAKKNITVTDDDQTPWVSNYTRKAIHKRAEKFEPYSNEKTRQEMILLSWPPDRGAVPMYSDGYRFDDVAGLGTFVYGCDYGITRSHQEFELMDIRPLFPGPFPMNIVVETDRGRHGSKCMAKAAGQTKDLANMDETNQFKQIAASATVAGLAAYFRSLDPGGLRTAAAVKTEILRWAYMRQRQGDMPATAEFRPRVIWNAQYEGRSLVGRCDDTRRAKLVGRDDACPVAFPPSASPVTLRTGSAAPTCTSGPRCGSPCEGFFCEGSPLQQNPDFLDPLNPDSVQNPTGPNYGNWNGNRTITPLPTGPPTTPTPPVTPKPSQNPTTTTSPPHSVPTIGSGLLVLEILWYAQPLLDLELELTGWYYMQGKVGGRSQDLCGNPFDKVTYDPGEDRIPTLPPDNDFHGWTLFAEYGKCQYHARGLDPPEPGYVTCDKGGRFDCILDEAGTIDCGGGDWRTPTVRCDFPAVY